MENQQGPVRSPSGLEAEARAAALEVEVENLKEKLDILEQRNKHNLAELQRLSAIIVETRQELDKAHDYGIEAVVMFACLAMRLGWRVGRKSERRPEEESPVWRLYIETPNGQVSWEFKDKYKKHVLLFPQLLNAHWDGHTTINRTERLMKTRRALLSLRHDS